MTGRRVVLYFSWSREDEVGAPLGVLEDRFPALFEFRRLFWPRYEHLADASQIDQGIDGFLDHIQLENFKGFAEHASAWSGNPVRIVERASGAGHQALDDHLLGQADTLIVVSFDSSRSRQRASEAECDAVKRFLHHPNHTAFVCPHHSIGDASDLPAEDQGPRREMEFHHHGDPAIPARQSFGDFGLSLLQGLGTPVRNRFGLKPSRSSDGSPAPIVIETALDRAHFLEAVTTFNLHPHLPHFERVGAGITKFDVLARQPIDLTAPPHPFVEAGGRHIDALLQSKPGVFAGRLLVCDTTLWSSTVGGLESLQRFWRNVVTQPL